MCAISQRPSARSTQSITRCGGTALLTLKFTQRRHCGTFSPPTMVNLPFISRLFGSTTISPLRVRTAVCRQCTSITRPLTSSTLIQSPMPTDLSSCSDSPPRMLPSVSCIEKAMMAVITAEVVTRLDRLSPA